MRHETIVRTALLALMCCVLSAGSAAYAAPDTYFETASALSNKDSGKAETSVGDLVADAVRSVLHTDVAFVASSELKPQDTAVPAGKASSSLLASLVSYSDDPLATMELTGKTLRAALERSVSIYPQTSMFFLQVSGLRFSFNPGSPQGQRVQSITVDGKALSDDARYKIGLTNSLANGALGYWKVWPRNESRTRFPDITLIKALESYLKANPRIDYSRMDRISTSPG